MKFDRLFALAFMSMSTLPPCPDSDLHDTIRQMEALTGQKAAAPSAINQPCNPCGTYSATVMPEDRFTGERKILTSLVSDTSDTSSDMRPIAMWSSTSTDKVALLFTGSHNDWQYLQCGETSMSILIDGKRVEIQKTQHEGKVLRQSESVMETMIVLIDRSALEGVVRVDSIFEYKICNDEFKADTRFTCELRSLLDKSNSIETGR